MMMMIMIIIIIIIIGRRITVVSGDIKETACLLQCLSMALQKGKCGFLPKYVTD